MVVVKLQGGLGNQMFQYALGFVLAQKFGSALSLDCSFFSAEPPPGITPRGLELNIFDTVPAVAPMSLTRSFLEPSVSNRIKKKLGLNYKKIIVEKSFAFNKEVLNVRPPFYLEGFWQTEKYFSAEKNSIRQLFTFKNGIDSETAMLQDSIQKENAVSVHIRRGDFLSAKNLTFHGACSLAYYQDSLAFINSRFSNLHYYIFTDDPAWAADKLNFIKDDTTLVTHNTKENSWQDMYLMSLCKHNIIANSSFSWWGAWLNKNPNKFVIAPEKWLKTDEPFWNYSDVVPEGWMKIQND